MFIFDYTRELCGAIMGIVGTKEPSSLVANGMIF